MVISRDLLPGGSRKVKAKRKVQKAKSVDCAVDSAPRTPPEDPMKNRPKKEDAVEAKDYSKSE